MIVPDTLAELRRTRAVSTLPEKFCGPVLKGYPKATCELEVVNGIVRRADPAHGKPSWSSNATVVAPTVSGGWPTGVHPISPAIVSKVKDCVNAGTDGSPLT